MVVAAKDRENNKTLQVEGGRPDLHFQPSILKRHAWHPPVQESTADPAGWTSQPRSM